MRVVVTGATGNIGTALLRALTGPAGPSWEVTGVARREPRSAPPYDRVSWERCDIGGQSAVDRLSGVFRGADVVIHLAWAIHPSTMDPDMRRTNLAGTGNVLRAVAAAGVRQLVCTSSVAAYSPAPEGNRVPETWPTTGVAGSAYSRQKAAMEAMLDRFEAEHPAVVVARIRPCAVLSEEAGTELASWMVSALLPTVLAGRPPFPMPVWPGLRVQAVHARDVADAILRIVQARSRGAFNLAAEPVIRRTELAGAGLATITLPYRAIEYAAGLAWRAGLQPLHPGWLRLAGRAALVDSARAREQLGWAPGTSATAALREAVEAIRQARAGASPPLASPGPDTIRIGRPSRQSQYEP